MKVMIGETAGRIWQILGEKGEMDITQLAKILKQDDAIVYQALGWLAREGKIESALKDKTEYISLTEAEREIYLKKQREGQCR
jgi:Mn-dependent DtxR family transcriptional regulator